MRLAVQLIGTPQFQVDGVPVTPSRRAVVALLAYLTVRSSEHPGQRFGRESLALLLWTDYDQTKTLANLRHTLWEVTKFLGEGWIIPEHETIHWNANAQLSLDVAGFRSLDQPQSALPHAQQLIALDPLNEAAQRELMELYALSQQYPAAIRQYQALEKLLRRELNVDPQPETRELYKKIRRGQWEPAAPAGKIPRW